MMRCWSRATLRTYCMVVSWLAWPRNSWTAGVGTPFSTSWTATV